VLFNIVAVLKSNLSRCLVSVERVSFRHTVRQNRKPGAAQLSLKSYIYITTAEPIVNRNHRIITKNSAIADKPRDAFVQMQWRGWPKNMPLPICVTMMYLVVLR